VKTHQEIRDTGGRGLVVTGAEVLIIEGGPGVEVWEGGEGGRWKRGRAKGVPEGRWVMKVDAGREVAIVGAKKVRAVKVSEEI
jgi:hypothetical protein